MRAIFLFFICLTLGINSTFAYELVLPKEKKTIVSTNYAFFIGTVSNNEVITINDEKVYTASNGAFAYSIKLKDGENRIVVKSNYNTQIYKVIKETLQKQVQKELIEFGQSMDKLL